MLIYSLEEIYCETPYLRNHNQTKKFVFVVKKNLDLFKC